MGKFQNDNTKVVVSVDDSKDDRFASGWSSYSGEESSPEESSSDGKPAGNASIEDWQEYARAQGASDADLEGKTRNELRDGYGS